jgi:ankyrin repeat protein
MKTLITILMLASSVAIAAENTKATPAAPKSPAKLIAAAKSGDVVAIEKQLKRGIAVDSMTDDVVDGYTALGWAAYHGHKEAVELLLEKGANINAANRSGYTPLMAAAQQSHDRIARLLLEKGANPNLATLNGDTALIYASMFGSTKTVEALLSKGADRSATNKLGDTAQTLANALGRTEIATVLADAKEIK